MGTTSIEWTATVNADGSVSPGRTVNPIRFGLGHYCQKISPGCTHCYASRFQPRVGNPQFGGVKSALPIVVNEETPRAGALWFDESKLQEVLRRKKPTKWFWCDMTDLFGSWVPDEWIDRCFATMALTPWHTHQVLTKRADRVRHYFTNGTAHGRIWAHWMRDGHAKACLADKSKSAILPEAFPNVWLGVSVEDQQRADERIPHLLKTPAAVRFLSCEPLLGPIELGQYLKGIDWAIIGGESGPRARPCDIEWIRDIWRQCDDAAVYVFVKQLGGQPYDHGSQPAGGWWPNQKAYCKDIIDGREVYMRILKDRKGGDPAEWPEDLRVREFPAMVENGFVE